MTKSAKEVSFMANYWRQEASCCRARGQHWIVGILCFLIDSDSQSAVAGKF